MLRFRSVERAPGVRLGLAFLAIAALGVATSCGPRAAPAPQRPARIILISMDTVRADHVSGWGDPQATPQLAAIAAEGARFQHFYSAASFTIPSHMSIFTGLDPAEHRVYGWRTRLAPEVPTLAEELRSAGYQTQAFHEGGFIAPRFGFDRGFDAYEEQPRITVVREQLPQVLAWIREHAGQPYFLFLHTYAAHSPYGGYGRYVRQHPERELPKPDQVQALIARYPAAFVRGGGFVPPQTRILCSVLNQLAERREQALACGGLELPPSFPSTPHFESDRAAFAESYRERIRLIDHAIGEIRASLVELGEWDDTLFIVTSDHGEAFFEHGGLSQHSYEPFDEVLHVPLVVSYPRVLGENAGTVVEEPTSGLDLFPTILGFAGITPPEGLRGRDLRGAMSGSESLPADRPIFSSVMRLLLNREPVPPRQVVRVGPLKWIQGHPLFGSAEPMLFDLSQDPDERHDLCAARPDDCRRMEELAAARDRTLEPRWPVDQQTGERLTEDAAANEEVDVPPAEREKLRALGYAD